MPIDVQVLCRNLDVPNTILIFGAGSSAPSGAPTATQLTARLSVKFGVSPALSLSDMSTVIEKKFERKPLIEYLTTLFQGVSASGGLRNLPDYDWAGIYTTNYDTTVEKAYEARAIALNVYSSNYDFSGDVDQSSQSLYKIHGTVGKDVSLGHQERMILTAADYDRAQEYRQILYARLGEQMLSRSVVIIGQSLADPDLKALVDQALDAKSKNGAPGNITIFVYEKNEDQAIVYEARGINVAFGDIDEFFSVLTKLQKPEPWLPGVSDNILDSERSVIPSTIEISEARLRDDQSLSRVFNGSPAYYNEIDRGWTFKRDFSDQIEAQLCQDGSPIALVLGPAGCGKTTGARQALLAISNRDIPCWEHQRHLPFPHEGWVNINTELRKRKMHGAILIDDAHEHLHDINQLLEVICAGDVPALKLILVSSKPHWNPRLKVPYVYSMGEAYEIGKLSNREIESLLDILENTAEIADLVERRFLGFSRNQRRTRLEERCSSDMFVCMKNIFGFDSFDDIILREYASLNQDYQETYKRIAGMEAAGVKVHRQLVMRTIGIQPNQVERYLDDLDGIINENTVNRRDGIYSWSVRHSVIADIISDSKYQDDDEFFRLIDSTIENLNPTYPLEVTSLNEICGASKGLKRIISKNKQNILLRKMISVVPQERVPRHRLITNLIDIGDYEGARTEIRLFENEIRLDGPVQRYKVKLLLARARHSKGLMQEDRISLVRQAASMAEEGAKRFKFDKNICVAFLEVGVAYFKLTKDESIFDQAMKAAKATYDRLLDPEFRRRIRHFEGLRQRFPV